MALHLHVKIHPVVLCQIVDSYERRHESAMRTVGALLGTVDKGFVEVTNCFAIPCVEGGEEVNMGLDFAKDVFDLHQKVNQTEGMVGWYATSPYVNEHSLLIHDYFARECNQPIHLTVDTFLKNINMDIKAYVSMTAGVPNHPQGTIFAPISVEIITYEPELIGVQIIQKIKKSSDLRIKCPTELSQIASITASLEKMLDILSNYVEEVISGHITPDNQIGRLLLKLVNSIPKMNVEDFEEMLNTNVKDLLMVIYLSQLCKTQVLINEKLCLLTL